MQRHARTVNVGLLVLVLLAAIGDATVADALTARIDRGPGSVSAEPEIAVDPADPRRVLVVAKNLSPTGRHVLDAFRSTDGGATFDGGTAIGGSYLGATADASDPVAVFNRLGTAYFGQLAWRYPGAGFESVIGVQTSGDGGASFAPPTPVVREANVRAPLDFGAPPGSSITHDKEWLAVDRGGGATDGNLYTSWVRVKLNVGKQTNRIAFARSTDGGASFGPAQLISRRDRFALGPQVAVTADAAVHVVWASLRRSETDRRVTVLVATSRDGGLSFSAPRAVARFANQPTSSVAGDNLVALASSGNGLLACWPQALSARVSSAVCGASPDGMLWTNPRSIAPQRGGMQALVAAIGDGTGYWVSFVAQRSRRSSMRVYRVSSGGRRTGAAHVLARRNHDVAGSAFLGDYLGIDTAGGRVFVAFAWPLAGPASRLVIYVRSFATSP